MRYKGIYIPEDVPMSFEDISLWYENIAIELQNLKLNSNHYKKIKNYYKKAGLLNNALKHKFFHHHFSSPLSIVINELFGNSSKNFRIFDLGCGFGTQSLLFALLGAEVIALDLDKESLKILQIRKSYYENIINKPLLIHIHNVNAFEFNYELHAPYDAVYSLFAFNLIQPSSKLLDLITPKLKNNAVLAVQDGNKRMWFNRLFRPRSVLSKKELYKELIKRGFHDIKSIGGYAVPPQFCQFLPDRLLRRVDSFLTKFEIFSASYLYIAKFQ